MKSKRRLLIAASVVIAAAAGFIHYYNPFAPSYLGDLLSVELSKMQSVKLGKAEGMTNLTYIQVNRKYASYWNDTAAVIRGSGASDDEVRAVIAIARRHFAGDGPYTDFTYGVPVTTKLIWHRFQPIWLIGFRWGIGYEDTQRGLTEPPSHIRILAISARRPYKLLSMQTCG